MWYSDVVGRTTHLHHHHVLLGLPLVQVPVVQLVHAAREQHPLQVLAALAVWEVAVRDALREGAREARDHRLAELDLMRRSRRQSRGSAASLRAEQ